MVFLTATHLFGQLGAYPSDPQYSCRYPYTAPWNGAPLPALNNNTYNAYIPGDNVIGGSWCYWYNFGNYYPFQKHYKADGYPVGQYGPVTPARVFHTQFFYSVGANQASAVVHDASQTRAYGAFSPANGYTLSAADEDNVWWDCFLFHASGYGDTSGYYEQVTFPSSTQAQVHLWGTGTNPLETGPPYATIQWDATVSTDYSNPDWVTASAYIMHTCFPAHVLKAQEWTLYHWMPPSYDSNYIYSCLVYHSNMINAVSFPTRVPCQ
jgi:hypothetical protein